MFTVRKSSVIKLRKSLESFVSLIAFDFAGSQIDRAVEVTHITLEKQLILQHGAEGRGNRHGQLERHRIARQPLHHADQRQVRFRDGLEEPVFLEKLVVLGMPHEWQMRVKNERERAGRHCGFRIADCGKISGYRLTLESRGLSAIRNPKSAISTASGRNPEIDQDPS